MRPSSRALIACVLAGALAVTSACSAPTPARPGATVTVDLFSGRDDPVVSLDAGVTDDLVAYLDTKGPDAFSTLTATQQVGFGGLVVELDSDADAPSSVRVMPHAVYVTDSIGTVRISDLAGTAYDLVWASVKPQLEPDVVAAVEEEL